jgi:hypothetical protein
METAKDSARFETPIKKANDETIFYLVPKVHYREFAKTYIVEIDDNPMGRIRHFNGRRVTLGTHGEMKELRLESRIRSLPYRFLFAPGNKQCYLRRGDEEVQLELAPESAAEIFKLVSAVDEARKMRQPSEAAS